MRVIKKNWIHLFRCLVCIAVSACIFAASDADAKRQRNAGRVKKTAIIQPRGEKDARYADIILNPVTGEIYHQTNADARRYPASLTKMMTLYLLFDALERDKISLHTKLDVSDYAASMPQTNLALSAGDEIPVEVAIKALVVRSANDVSVVVAEALAGSVEDFAERMTAKARALGMRNTVFRNPNGLPNSGQYTTARDMAKLGIALKRDFPQYYDYFVTRQFSWNGVTYYTHNRVMLRYAGTDGIKTGYIGLSGFNVVSSVVRGGRPLVGTVMGGSSGRWRDDRMIALLDESYQKIAERGATRGKIYPENLPLFRNPKTGVSKGKGIPALAYTDTEALNAPQTLPEAKLDTPAGEAEDGAIQVETVPVVQPEQYAPVAPPAVVSVSPSPVTTEQVAPPAEPAPATPANNYIRIVPLGEKAPAAAVVNPPPAVSAAPSPVVAKPAATVVIPPVAAPAVQKSLTHVEATWGIQVGAFSSNALAVAAANEAYAKARTALAGAEMLIVGPEVGGAPIYRARIAKITENQSKAACKTLIAQSTPCFAFRVN